MECRSQSPVLQKKRQKRKRERKEGRKKNRYDFDKRSFKQRFRGKKKFRFVVVVVTIPEGDKEGFADV
jgi:hypothetical protein